MFSDMKFVVRSLLKTPWLSTVVVLTLALSIGNSLTSDVTLEFAAAPGPDTIHMWPALGKAAVEGNKLSVDFDKAGEKKVIDTFVERA